MRDATTSDAEGSKAKRRCGAVGEKDGAVRWRVWARRAGRVDLVLLDGPQHREVPMQAEERGFFHAVLPAVTEGQRYAFRLDGGPERPDPCSLWQPDGVHGSSALVRPEKFAWTDQNWKGIPCWDLVFYELHVGTFTSEGTFEAVVPRLKDLRELGITAVELMPVGQFPGSRNWGYDGVLPYAVQNNYGGPHGLQKLVDACHAAGLAVFLDVVYNHFGPEGNYLAEFAPYFTDHYKTPWGMAVNFDGAGSDAVRDFVLDNARMWLEEFHFDGLRLDAVHAIYDLGARHILRAVKEVAEDVARRAGRLVHIISESDLNDPRLLLPPERGGYGLDAQWSDDFHHAAHAFFTGERNGYYQDFGSAKQLAKALTDPFLYAWDYSPHRDKKHGASPARTVRRSLRRLPAKPRSGRQPRPRRSLPGASARPGQAAVVVKPAAFVAVFAAPVHGRGVRRRKPISVLLFVQRSPAHRGRARGPQARVRRLRRSRRGARPARRSDVPVRASELVLARRNAEGGVARDYAPIS